MKSPKYHGAGIICIRPDSKILILKSKYHGEWSVPKGYIDAKERNNPVISALRELKEETGLTLNSSDLITDDTGELLSYDFSYKLKKPRKKVPDGIKRVLLFVHLLKGEEKWKMSHEHSAYHFTSNVEKYLPEEFIEVYEKCKTQILARGTYL